MRGRKCQSSCYFVAVAWFALDLEKDGTRIRIGFQEQNCIRHSGVVAFLLMRFRCGGESVKSLCYFVAVA